MLAELEENSKGRQMPLSTNGRKSREKSKVDKWRKSSLSTRLGNTEVAGKFAYMVVGAHCPIW